MTPQRGNAGWIAGALLLALSACERRDAGTPQAKPRSAAVAPQAQPPPQAASAVPSASTAPAPSFRLLEPGLSVFRTERADADGRATEWIIVRADLDVQRPGVRALGEHPFSELSNDARIAVGVNGGFFDPALNASGLLVSEGNVVARKRSGGGSGIVIVKARRARLLKRDEAVPRAVDFAVQCGPRLIETNGSIGIRSDDGKRAARTALCLRNAGRTLDFVIALAQPRLGDGPGLLELARTLARPIAPSDTSGCEAALNLDGGPSTGLTLKRAPELRRDPLGPVPFAIVFAH